MDNQNNKIFFSLVRAFFILSNGHEIGHNKIKNFLNHQCFKH